MQAWKIAAVQMDIRLADVAHNLALIRTNLAEAAGKGARLVIFPECALTGYCFESKEEAWEVAEPFPGPSIDAVAADCRRLGAWAIVGGLERGPAGALSSNSCALIGPAGFTATYRKTQIPFIGADRFTTPGDIPFAVHDLGGLRVGMLICYDGSFPEPARALMLLGADLVALSTNWPTGAMTTIKYLVQARALENHMYYAGVNRVGQERGFNFIGRSRIVDVSGELLAASDDEKACILYTDVDPERARRKHIVKIPGKYELHRINDRRPDLYGILTRPKGES